NNADENHWSEMLFMKVGGGIPHISSARSVITKCQAIFWRGLSAFCCANSFWGINVPEPIGLTRIWTILSQWFL
ncbi:hypothetical protein, partial [Vibrio anguillarum]